MKSITFRRSAQSGRFYTYQFNNEYQDKPTFLDELAHNSIIFYMLLTYKKFRGETGNNIVIGYTDRYGNKILQIR